MSKEETPIYESPTRTDASGEHSRFVPAVVRVVMNLLRREADAVSQISREEGVSFETTLEKMWRAHREYIANQKSGGRLIVVDKDGRAKQVVFNTDGSPKLKVIK